MMIQTPTNIEFLKIPSQMFFSSFILRAFIMLKICIITKTLKTIA